MPAPPPVPPETPPRRPVTPPTTRQIWTRSLVIGAVLGLFVSVGFGRFESERSLILFVVVTAIAAVVLGVLFSRLNAGGARR